MTDGNKLVTQECSCGQTMAQVNKQEPVTLICKACGRRRIQKGKNLWVEEASGGNLHTMQAIADEVAGEAGTPEDTFNPYAKELSIDSVEALMKEYRAAEKAGDKVKTSKIKSNLELKGVKIIGNRWEIE